MPAGLPGIVQGARGRAQWLRRVLRTASVRPRGPERGAVLLSYANDAFFDPAGPSPSHPHFWECQQMARTWAERGYAVDVVHYDNRWYRPRRPYDIVIDARHNLQRWASRLDPGCRRLFHIDTAHLLQQNAAEAARLLDVQQRRGVTLQPRRYERPNLGIEHAEAATIWGNDWTCSTWAYAGKPLHRVPCPSVVTFPFPADRDHAAARRRFLWLGSGGLVRKGLDLVLEAFADMPDVELFVCGPVLQEADFAAAYRAELTDTPNIHLVGWVDVTSESFAALARSCGAVVFASCSEGQASSVVTGMHAGLVPVITRETGVDIEPFGQPIDGWSVAAVTAAVRAVADSPGAELAERARATWDFARATHTRERYAEVYGDFADAVVAGSPRRDQGATSA